MIHSRTDADDPAAASDNRLVVAISSRALFDLGDSHALFERDGLDAYRSFQIDHENEILKPGVAFPLVQKLLAKSPADRFESAQQAALAIGAVLAELRARELAA